MAKSHLNHAASVIPQVQSYGFPHGASSASTAAYFTELNENNAQNSLNKIHGGSSGARMNVPQASTHGVTAVGPVNGNANATKGALTLTQSVANGEYDLQVGKNPPQSGGGCGCMNKQKGGGCGCNHKKCGCTKKNCLCMKHGCRKSKKKRTRKSRKSRRLRKKTKVKKHKPKGRKTRRHK
jgi:hypothetical protein